ncbi:Hypothetical predicted protein [Octopus vulgaris]|uniref:Swi5-dependent recombination DNA repair protein 1 homolog n=1 Tax=Octopus vulgaris TaxID=6645 RepID=A0AA36FD15_OCTVU|nr:Hypothetical predicted protein [Octopus vulgaris]
MDEQKTVQTPKGSSKLSSSLKERLKKCGRYYSPAVLKNASNPLNQTQPCTPDAKATAFSTRSLNCITPSSAGSPQLNQRTPVENYPSSLLLTPNSSKFHRHQLQEASSLLTPVLRKKNFHGQQDLRIPKAKRMCLASPTSEDPVASTGQEGQCLGATGTDTNKVCDILGEGNDEANEKLAVNSLLVDHEKDDSRNDSDDKLAVITGNCESSNLELRRRKSYLEKLLKEKREHLRKLNMVKLYRSKNDFANLDDLILKWTQVCQQVLVDLHSKVPEPKPTLTEFIKYFNIDFDFIKFNPENETFL